MWWAFFFCAVAQVNILILGGTVALVNIRILGGAVALVNIRISLRFFVFLGLRFPKFWEKFLL